MLTSEEIRDLVTRSRDAQGLPPTIEDSLVLESVAAAVSGVGAEEVEAVA